MRKFGLPQEALKIIACITMLIDHIGAILFPTIKVLRLIGRIAFPIYCFLLVEGYHHTRNLKKYGFRMIVGCLLAEIPYDLALFGEPTLSDQSVMVTLTLGLIMLYLIDRINESSATPFVVLGFYLLANVTACDYGGNGILMIALFSVFRTYPNRNLIYTLLLTSVCLIIPSGWIDLGIVRLPMQIFGIAAMPFIIMYSGKRITTNTSISTITQSAFYLFYPVHLAALWLVNSITVHP